MVPQNFDDDWLTRLFIFCTIGVIGLIEILRDHFIAESTLMWAEEEEKIHELREESTRKLETIDIQLSSLNTFIQCLKSSASAISLAEIYVLPKHARWNACV